MTPPATLRSPSAPFVTEEPAFSYARSEEVREWEKDVREVWRDFREPISNRKPAPAARFAALAERWREETAHLSSSTAIFTHPAYQQVIGMGPDALPHILRDLSETRSHWFWALRAIARENPVPPREAGNVERMIAAWLAWGVRRGLL